VSNNSSWVVYDKKKNTEIVERFVELAGVDNIPLKLNIV
jgi:hypothetical protein